MASLEELLAEEGFKKGRLKQGPRIPTAFSSQNPDIPTSRSADYGIRKGNSRFDAFSRRSRSTLSGNGRARRDGGLRKSLLQKNSSVDEFDKESPEIRGFEGGSSDEEFGGESGAQESKRWRDPSSDKLRRKESYNHGYRNSLYEEATSRTKKIGSFQVKPSFNDDNLENSEAEPQLDQAAKKALISILTAYIKRYFKDENFRVSTYQNCASCLGISSEEKEIHDKDSGVVINLKEAIRTVERVFNAIPSRQELKKASLKLSVITGLSSSELKDGFTSGIPNSNLAACAHLYLSVIYKLQKKDRVSAKHVLQVFCDSPNQARVVLLPGLWTRLFFPHLSHLKEWYNKEAKFIATMDNRGKKLKILEEIYNNFLDMSTCQFAVYYKDWLLEEVEAPEVPSVLFPVVDFLAIPEVNLVMPFQAVVSKKLYESVCSQSKKMQADDGVEEEKEEMNEKEVEQQEERESGTSRPKPGIHMGIEHLQESRNAHSPDQDASSNVVDWTANRYYHSSNFNVPEVKELNVEYEGIRSLPCIAGSIYTPNLEPEAKENELTLKRLAQAAFQRPMADRYSDVNAVSLKHTPHSRVYDLYHNNQSDIRCAKSELTNTEMMCIDSDRNALALKASTEQFGSFEGIDQGSVFSSIPKDFICPITGELFKDPVTLETGQTYERVAIKEWFAQGNKTCPVTRQVLENRTVPITNFVLKRVIDGWKSGHCRNLLFLATQILGNVTKQEHKSEDESALFIIEKLLTGFGIEEQMENAKYLISLGGLDFLIRRLELGSLEEKTRVATLILCCIKADGLCRSFIATNIGSACILRLLHCKQISARTNAVLLLIELFCLNRRTTIASFISGLERETILNTMHILLVYLRSSSPEERALIAVLLLHFELMVEPRSYGVYKEEAVDNITLALDCCLSDEKVISNSGRALLILGGHFSLCGEIMIDTWLLKQAGVCDVGFPSISYDDDVDDAILKEEEEAVEREEWLKNVAVSLLGSGKRSFLETLSQCLDSSHQELVRVCLTTVAWLTDVLGSPSLAEFRLSVFLALIPRLKVSLEDGQQIEHRVLASLSLLNFSKISECRFLLMTLAEDMRAHLISLVDVTWTAKHLYGVISGEQIEPMDQKGSDSFL